MSRIIAAVAIAVGVAFFSIALLLGTPASNGFLFAVGVTVAVVPCGLLPTVTLSLAMGAQRMAQRRALVRHLEAVETLGSTTFICTDKTGTLTQNEMSVVEIWMPDGTATVQGNGYEPTGELTCTPPACHGSLSEVARAARRCSSGQAVLKNGQWLAQGDPMEAALDAFAHRVGVDVAAEIRAAPERARFPFDARRRRMSVVVGNRVLVKGAPDAILSRCQLQPAATDALRRLTGRGLRVIAVATRAVTGDVPTATDEAERDLNLLGLVALEDPPRPEAAVALAACRRAGISVAMVTGDHPDTARAIAREIGLTGSNDRVLTGHELPTDRARLGELLDQDGTVVARVTPEDKLRIAEALQARGHVVAMTGDGVNDAPALREAAIGVAMGKSAPTSRARPLTLSCSTTTSAPSSRPWSKAGRRLPTSVVSSPITSPTTSPNLPPLSSGRSRGGPSPSPSACCRCLPSTSEPTYCLRWHWVPSHPPATYWSVHRLRGT